MPKVSAKDQPNIVWHAPETIANTLPDVAARFDEQMKGKTPTEILAAAAQLSGEYREYQGDEYSDEERAMVAVYGTERYVWVSDAPDDPKDGAGHFEVYDGPDENYRPVIQRVEDEN